VPRRGFTSNFFFLLGYLPATANEQYQSRFKVFHLVGGWTTFCLASICRPPWHG